MKKNELKNGDIVIARDGCKGVVIKTEKEEYIMYSNDGGYDLLADYTEEMVQEHDSGDPDIMQVYRADYGVCSFIDYEDYDLIYERDCNWKNPIKDESKVENKANSIAKEKNEDLIAIISQAYYGNRTGTFIKLEEMDRFILGYQDSKLKVKEPIDRSIIKIPGADNLVLIYNKYQEEKRLEYARKVKEKDGYVCKPVATIPELDIEIFSRCIVCRMNESGEFESLQEEDIKKFIHYLAA